MKQKNEDTKPVKEDKESKSKPVGIIFFLVFWAIVISLGFFFFGKDLGLGLTVAAILSYVFWQLTLNSQYSGVIESFETKAYRDSDGFEREQKRAVIRLENGKKKRTYYDPSWKVGDKIVKKKGEAAPSKI